jgi:hypothetical protein
LLSEAAGALAFAAWPQPRTTTPDALEILASWGIAPAVTSKFDIPSATTLVQRLSEAGILRLTPDAEFAHPLFATYLAAQHAAAGHAMTSPMEADPEFAMFVAALLGEGEHNEQLRHLARHGPVGQARYLRLRPEGQRQVQSDDAEVFGDAASVLSGRTAECIVTDQWTAWRSGESPGQREANEIDDWLASGTVSFLVANAFALRSPVDIATIESLGHFKEVVRALRPAGERFDRLRDAELRKLRKLPRAELDELIVQAVVDWRSDWRAQAEAMGVSTLAETTIGSGDPAITVLNRWPDPGLRIEWGGTAGVTWVTPEPKVPEWNYQPLSTYLNPGRSARVYHDLTERTERALGCRFSSQAWSRPEYVAAWAW